jgi:16S rRNA (adenine1518-N6/adenine1519-N6)-dimethyltransferase
MEEHFVAGFHELLAPTVLADGTNCVILPHHGCCVVAGDIAMAWPNGPRRARMGGTADPGATTHSARSTSGVPGVLRDLGVRPSRRLGQSFLSDPRVAERIAALVADPNEPVLEIGPGLGAITTLLARTGRPLAAVEIDHRLAEYLGRILEPYPAARTLRGDILDQRLQSLFPGTEFVTVVANLPYSITTPAIEWLLSQSPRVRRAYLMVQREYAHRLAASPGGKEFGSIAVFVGLHAEITPLFRVSPGAFHPRPAVDSVVLSLTPRAYPGSTMEERAAAERMARAGMGTKRKTVGNALARGLALDGAAVRQLLGAAGIDAARRGETLTIAEWLTVARRWIEAGRPGGAA